MEQIDVYKGDNLALPFVISLVDELGIETALNITGFNCFFTAKKHALDADADAVISKRWTSHSSPTTGTTELLLTPTDTQDLGSFTFDFGYVDLSGLKTTLLVGKLNITQQVTRTV